MFQKEIVDTYKETVGVMRDALVFRYKWTSQKGGGVGVEMLISIVES